MHQNKNPNYGLFAHTLHLYETIYLEHKHAPKLWACVIVCATSYIYHKYHRASLPLQKKEERQIPASFVRTHTLHTNISHKVVFQKQIPNARSKLW